jgi:PII-like signaling protein
MNAMNEGANQGGKAQGTEGVVLSFVLHEKHSYKGKPLYDWLLGKAQQLGIPGGSVYHGIAGYGRHGVLHEQHFFELAGDLPVQVIFICSEAAAQTLLDAVVAEKLSLFYAITPARYGITGQ